METIKREKGRKEAKVDSTRTATFSPLSLLSVVIIGSFNKATLPVIDRGRPFYGYNDRQFKPSSRSQEVLTQPYQKTKWVF